MFDFSIWSGRTPATGRRLIGWWFRLNRRESSKRNPTVRKLGKSNEMREMNGNREESRIDHEEGYGDCVKRKERSVQRLEKNK